MARYDTPLFLLRRYDLIFTCHGADTLLADAAERRRFYFADDAAPRIFSRLRRRDA